MQLRRRQFLLLGAALASAGADALAFAPRRLTLQNLHTDEAAELDYGYPGAYRPDAMAQVAALLRDFRTGEQHVIDPLLLDVLHDAALTLGADPVFGVISGYRSPQTNAILRSRSDGVALRSLHMEGRAIDVRLAGVDSARLAACAQNLGRGGVGYYRRADFVHLDTGTARTWRG